MLIVSTVLRVAPVYGFENGTGGRVSVVDYHTYHTLHSEANSGRVPPLRAASATGIAQSTNCVPS